MAAFLARTALCGAAPRARAARYAACGDSSGLGLGLGFCFCCCFCFCFFFCCCFLGGGLVGLRGGVLRLGELRGGGAVGRVFGRSELRGGEAEGRVGRGPGVSTRPDSRLENRPGELRPPGEVT